MGYARNEIMCLIDIFMLQNICFHQCPCLGYVFNDNVIFIKNCSS